MRKLFYFTLLFTLCLSFISCGSDTDEPVVLSDQEKYAPKIEGVWVQMDIRGKFIEYEFDFKGKTDKYYMFYRELNSIGGGTTRPYDYKIDKDSIYMIASYSSYKSVSYKYQLSDDNLYLSNENMRYKLYKK